MDPCWRSLFYIAAVCIAIVSTREYPDCVNATCPMVGCRTVALDFTSTSTEVYSRSNVICFNNTRPRTVTTYHLTGCPDIFSSIMGRIEGVCTNKTSQGIDLFLTLSEMVVGLYDFTCFTQPNSSKNFRSNYAIIVNDTNTYRDILVFVNGILAANSSVNVSINEGDNLTIVARAVGKVTNVEVEYVNATGFVRAADETHVFCGTGIPCGIKYSDTLDNRDQLCILTNAASSTDNQTLRFFVQYNTSGQDNMTELGEVNITVDPPIPSTTSIVTNSPMPTGPPTDKAGDGTTVAAIIIPTIVVVALIITIVILSIVFYFHYYRRSIHKSSSSQDDQIGGKSSPDGSLRKLKVLIYSCDHFNVDLLVNKLEENQDFDVKKLVDDPSSQLSDNVSKLHSEISHGSVLIDCSCPGGVHSTMHTVVKSYTQKPSGDSESSKWQIIQLNNCDADGASWSKLFDHVEVMDYHTLDVVLDHVESKLKEYSQSTTLSIHSENEDNVSVKQQLLPGEPVGATNERLLEKVEGLAHGIESLAAQSTSQHNKLLTSVEDHKERSGTITTQLDAIGKDTRTLVNNIQPSE